MTVIAFLDDRSQQAGYLLSLADANSVPHDRIVRTDDGWDVPSVVSDDYTELDALAWPPVTSAGGSIESLVFTDTATGLPVPVSIANGLLVIDAPAPTAVNDDPLGVFSMPATAVRGESYTRTDGSNLMNLDRRPDQSFWYHSADGSTLPLDENFVVNSNSSATFRMPFLPLGPAQLILRGRGASRASSAASFTVSD